MADDRDEELAGDAANAATDLGEELAPVVRAAADRVADEQTFWECFLHYWLGAVRARCGDEVADAVERSLAPGWYQGAGHG